MSSPSRIVFEINVIVNLVNRDLLIALHQNVHRSKEEKSLSLSLYYRPQPSTPQDPPIITLFHSRPSLRNTPILRLPSIEVQQRRQRLPQDREEQPEDHITCDFAAVTFETWDLGDEVGYDDEGDLPEHAGEGDACERC